MQISGTGQGTPENWSSRFGFMMASVGFAVGLGNIWRFPYITGENGGGAFVLIYIACALGIGVPILMAEVMLGRRGQQTPDGAMRRVAQAEGASSRWRWVGVMTLLTAFLILATYAVVAGWVLEYLFFAVGSGFADLTSAEASGAAFSAVLADNMGMLLWTFIALALTGAIVASGVKDGIERVVSVLMPTLFLLLVVLVVYGAVVGDFGRAMAFLFQPDFSKITASTALVAIGQAFFSVGVAMAGMMTYGAYLPKSVSIGRSVILIIFADTLVALLAGMAIFPLVFQHGLDPSGGPGLIFETLPLAFADMPGGHFFSVLFFALLSVAAVTSMVGLFEPLVARVTESQRFARRRAALLLVAAVLLLSVVSILSYNVWSDVRIIGGLNLNGLLGMLTDQIGLPLGGLLIAIFVGWFVSDASCRDELAIATPALYNAWRFLLRYPVPLAIAAVLVLGLTG